VIITNLKAKKEFAKRKLRRGNRMIINYGTEYGSEREKYKLKKEKEEALETPFCVILESSWMLLNIALPTSQL
jgi:hypothetical protein